MKKVLAAFVATLCVCVGARAQERPVAFEGATLVTISGPVVPDGVLVVHRGKIVAAGPRAAVSVPAGARRPRKGRHTYPDPERVAPVRGGATLSGSSSSFVHTGGGAQTLRVSDSPRLFHPALSGRGPRLAEVA